MSQYDIYNFLKLHPNNWFTVDELEPLFIITRYNLLVGIRKVSRLRAVERETYVTELHHTSYRIRYVK